MNDNQVTVARSHSLADLLHRSAARFPAKTALIDGETSFTFAQLDAAVSATAGALLDRGLSKGDRLAILSRNSWQFAVLSFACARAGVVFVPINFMLKANEVEFILAHSGATTAVADDGALLATLTEALDLAGIEPVLRGWIGPDGSPVPEGWESVSAWARGVPREIDVIVGDDDPIRIMYTSGTESRPKGALSSSRSLITEYVSSIVDGGMSRDDVDLHTLPLYHCAQLDCFLGPDIYLGATSIVLPAPDPATVLRLIETHKVSKYFAPPTVWISLLRHPDFDRYDLSSLRKGYYGASPMPVEVLREIQSRLPNLRLWNFYGQTEMAPVATILPPEEQVEFAGSAGRAVLNVETRVVDEDDRPVPPGVIGEVVHRSPHATLGYYKDPEKTAEALDEEGWFHTGDIGSLDAAGTVMFHGRLKDMLKVGGENVAAAEIETCLQRHPAVKLAQVVGVPDVRLVEVAAAFIECHAQIPVTAEELIEFCRREIAGFKVPRHVRFVSEWPMSTSKIQKFRLRDQLLGELGLNGS